MNRDFDRTGFVARPARDAAPAPRPDDQERSRLAVLREYAILDTRPEVAFDDIALLARQICGLPIALISFVDESRQWFKSHCGIDADETPRSSSLCQHAMLEAEVFVVDDTWADARFADNPLVTGPPYMRFYAGAPLRTAAGVPLGALCVIGTEPRTLPDDQRSALTVLANQVMAQLELRRLLATTQERERRTRRIANELGSTVNRRDRELEAMMADLAQQTGDRELAEEALRQAQKMEAVGQLTGGLAHDFNNLLTGVIGSLQLMQRGLAADAVDTLPRLVDQAMASARRAAGLTHRLLAFSRQQTLMPAAIDVNRLVGSLEDLLRRTLGPSVDLAMQLDPSAPVAVVDANQLENALLNLAINARDAMPDGGRLTIGTERVDAAGSRGVRLRVTDTGVGMPPHALARAFDPFFTTKPIGEGTGLGLSMVYGFARQSKGDAVIRSTEGIGTTIELTLPMAEGAHTAAVLVPVEVPVYQPAARRRQLLIVEDQLVVREVMSELLVELGYSVLEAADASEALPILQSDAIIDLLITDVGLPGINGRQLADSARLLRPEIPVLFATGYADKMVAGERLQDTGMSILVKPFDLDTLSQRVRALLPD